MFIYKIENIMNGKIYIGQTNLIKKRWNEHRSRLKKNKHENSYLQASWNKYGETSFVFEVVEQFDSSMNFDLNNLERYWIKFYHSNNRQKGYNLTEGGEGPTGYRFTTEQRKKISNAHKGKTLSLEHRKSISESLFGRVCSDSTRDKLSESKKRPSK